MSKEELTLIEMFLLSAAAFIDRLDDIRVHATRIAGSMLYNAQCSEQMLKTIAIAFPDEPTGQEAQRRLDLCALGRREPKQYAESVG